MKLVEPRTEGELAALVREARGVLRIRGGGTRLRQDGPAVSVAGIKGVELYEPGALTLVARAGTPVAEIEALLQAEGQRLAFEPMDYRPLLGGDGMPTIGGVFATNTSGPRRIQAGAARDFLLGVRFVDGQGAVLQNGGRVMKNVTGYDLVKLMAGSWGTLGVMSEVSLKVMPVPETQATLVLHGLDVAQAVAAMSAALGSPYEVTGAAYAGDVGTVLRLEGFAASVAYRAVALTDKLAGFGEISQLGPEESEATWRALRDVQAFADQPGDVWRISAKPSAAPVLVALLGDAQVQLDWGGGLIWALVPQGQDIRAQLGRFDGHATRVRGQAGDGIARFAPEPPGVAALSQALRARFDPRGILNPGLMDA